MLKAYMVHPGESPEDEGCCLVYAENRNQARQHANGTGPWFSDYINMRAVRRPYYDQWVKEGATAPYIIEENDELPSGAPAFFDDDI